LEKEESGIMIGTRKGVIDLVQDVMTNFVVANPNTMLRRLIKRMDEANGPGARGRMININTQDLLRETRTIERIWSRLSEVRFRRVNGGIRMMNGIGKVGDNILRGIMEGARGAMVGVIETREVIVKIIQLPSPPLLNPKLARMIDDHILRRLVILILMVQTLHPSTLNLLCTISDPHHQRSIRLI
jgi:hypothetical protein